MSTFNGVVKEFPDIRIDYFRNVEGERAPLACMLSHIHSDHLVGLEAHRSPFVYCSPATAEMVQRLEKRFHRMNFAKGILEHPTQTYKLLKKLLIPIPLETPTVIELSPNNRIRLTLYDANHCIGAVCFLIEGLDNGKTIFYTGDVRSERWWVKWLQRQPTLLPFVVPQHSGTNATSSQSSLPSPIKLLDCLYLDTTFATKSDPYREFPSKADGLLEMLAAVSQYPAGTNFYFDSWTFGYEDVWQTLSTYLHAQIHVDDYRMSLYQALLEVDPKPPDVAKLIGHKCGNHIQKGCLTRERGVQIHSCEQGTACDIWSKDFVRVTPIISRHKNTIMPELGAGGGQDDFADMRDLLLGDAATIAKLITLCVNKLEGQPEVMAKVVGMLTRCMEKGISILTLGGSELGEDARAALDEGFDNVDDLPLERLVPALVHLATRGRSQTGPISASKDTASRRAVGLPKQITFPYSRHSSYAELCDLVSIFKPKDIHPCTVEEKDWYMDQSMAYLFGHLYDFKGVPPFSYDWQMMKKRGFRWDGSLVKPFFSTVADGFAKHQLDAGSSNQYDDGEHGSLQAVDPGPHEVTRRSTAEGRRVYIGGLPPNVTVDDIEGLLRRYEVDNLYLSEPSSADGRSYACVDLPTRPHAMEAIRELNDTQLRGFYVHVRLVRNGKTEIHPLPTDIRYGLREEAHGAALGHNVDWREVGMSCGGLGSQAMDEEL